MPSRPNLRPRRGERICLAPVDDPPGSQIIVAYRAATGGAPRMLAQMDVSGNIRAVGAASTVDRGALTVRLDSLRLSSPVDLQGVLSDDGGTDRIQHPFWWHVLGYIVASLPGAFFSSRLVNTEDGDTGSFVVLMVFLFGCCVVACFFADLFVLTTIAAKIRRRRTRPFGLRRLRPNKE